jgi:hypothetical protein
MKKNIQKQNRYGREVRPGSPSPQRASSGQTEPGISQKEGNDYAAHKEREKARGYHGRETHICDHCGNEQYGHDVARDHECL